MGIICIVEFELFVVYIFSLMEEAISISLSSSLSSIQYHIIISR